MRENLLIFLDHVYSVLTKTWLQGLNKLKNYRLWWLFEPLSLTEFETL